MPDSLFRRFFRYAAPALLLLVLYWPGLTNWFYQDDFGWLNLRHDVHSAGDLGAALFAPKAHGNIRPLGENAYFLILGSIFGVDALPFRVVAFATQIGSLFLLGAIVFRLTRARLAALGSQVLWIVNPGLAHAMCWTSIYNQVLSGFFLLLAFWFLLRYEAGGARRDAIGHWAAFILGLGALETNVLYPAIAAMYTLLFARRLLKKIAPMFAMAAVYLWLHFHFAPAARDGVYAIRIDARVFATFAHYWLLALAPARSVALLLSAALLAFAIWCARVRQFLPLFGLGWFMLVIAPYLPLPDHRMDYYLGPPVAGLAIAAASMAPFFCTRSFGIRAAGLGCAILYVAVSAPAARRIADWSHDRGTRVEDLALGVAEIHAAQPGKTILLDGVDNDLFWSGIADLPFRAMEIPHVYLAPGAETRIDAAPDFTARYTLPQALALPALQTARAVVYQTDGRMLRNITTRYTMMADASWKPATPRFINLGDDVFSPYLGPGWDAASGGTRWLPHSATARVGGPGPRLHIGVFRSGAFRLGVRIGGIEMHPAVLQSGGDLTELGVDLPPALAAMAELEVNLTNENAAPLKFGFLSIPGTSP